jgi:hypothetical protein
MTFLDHIRDNYNIEELNDIVNHGCASGCAGTMIYYSDTTDLYDQFADELHEMIAFEVENFGEVPGFITEALRSGSVAIFKNAVVWFVAETYAFRLVNEAEEAQAN